MKKMETLKVDVSAYKGGKNEEESLTLSIPIMNVHGKKMIAINLNDWEHYGSDLDIVVFKERKHYEMQKE